jgi:hypothetical protein
MRIAKLSFLAAACLSAAPALAHEGGTHERGTVKEVTAERIVLATGPGAEVTVRLLPSTQIVRGKHAIQATEIHPGERAVVHATKHDGELEASEVMVAEPKQ